MNVDLTFPHHYELVDPSMATDARVYPFGVLSNEAASPDSLVVAVAPGGDTGSSWVGRFEQGSPIATALSGVFSLPDPDQVCVVSGGQAFVVCANNPLDWEALKAPFPVTRILAVPEVSVLLLIDFTHIAAMGENGVSWTSNRLSWDGIDVKDVVGSTLLGFGWSAPEHRHVGFRLDLRTGDVRN
jgi:hypothetical protein